LKHMIHKHTTRCKKEDGSCQYKYPQKINPTTTIDDRGYVHYKRSTVDDTNVVPYNPHLLLLAESHINVEIASTVNLIMYLYKYLFKGGDNARFVLTDGEDVDEIKDYIKKLHEEEKISSNSYEQREKAKKIRLANERLTRVEEALKTLEKDFVIIGMK